VAGERHFRGRGHAGSPGNAWQAQFTHAPTQRTGSLQEPTSTKGVRHDRGRHHAGHGVPCPAGHRGGGGLPPSTRPRRSPDQGHPDDDLRHRRSHRQRGVPGPTWACHRARAGRGDRGARSRPHQPTRSASGSWSARSRPVVSARHACPGTCRSAVTGPATRRSAAGASGTRSTAPRRSTSSSRSLRRTWPRFRTT
jgi:hypothetical protein